MKKEYNQWLHPDMIGVHFPYDDLTRDTIEFQEMLSVKKYKLYTFEMKISLNFFNFREYFFQAASNSSWANEGLYSCFKYRWRILSELKRLNNAFGIAVIKNPINVSQIEIILTAKNSVLD